MSGDGILNPPGQKSIRYRIGTQPTFFRRLLERLPEWTVPSGPNQGAQPLQALTTRSTGDFSIALLYAWASVGDLLTFYQERLANEGFLGTAVERQSLVELARLVGYQPLPGLAATAWLALSVEEAEGAPREVALAPLLPVQSVPPSGGMPQTFETDAGIVARARWNALRPRLTRPQELTPESRQLYLQGTDADLEQGDPLLLARPVLRDGQPYVAWRLLRLQEVEVETDLNRTRVSWREPLGESELLPQPLVYALRAQAAPFGYDAPDWQTQPFEVQLANTPPGYQPQDFATWPGLELRTDRIDLDAEYPQVLPGGYMVQQQPSRLGLYEVRSAFTVYRQDYTLSGQVTRVLPGFHETLPCNRVLVPGREEHSATLLPDGTVLVAGGRDADGGALRSCQLYDPATGTVRETGALEAARWGHTATLLANATLLIAGGQDAGGNALASAELYRIEGPEAGTFASTGSMSAARTRHATALLPDGQVLVSGGWNAAGGTLKSAELYDPSTGTFQGSTDGDLTLTTPRESHSATLLAVAGVAQVLVAGGFDGSQVTATAETYAPATKAFTAIANAMSSPRQDHTATFLQAAGVVLVAGGRDDQALGALASADLYAPGTGGAAGTFTATGPMQQARFEHTAALLQDGLVLVSGGTGTSGAPLRTCEAFRPGASAADGAFLRRVDLVQARTRHTTTLLAGGQAVVAGGDGEAGVLDTLERYDPAVETFVPTGGLPVAEYAGAGALLQNGYALVTGGFGYAVKGYTDLPNAGLLNQAELYDPHTGLFTATGAMNTCRAWHAAAPLDSGSVLVAGGQLAVYEADIQEILDLLDALRATVVALTPTLDDINTQAQQADALTTQIQTTLQGMPSFGYVSIDGGGRDYRMRFLYSFDYYLSAKFYNGGGSGDHTKFPWIWYWGQAPSDPAPPPTLTPQTYWNVVGGSIGWILYSIHSKLTAIEADVTQLEQEQQAILDQIDAIIAALEEFAGGPLYTAEVYDPATGKFAGTNEPMVYLRERFTATPLPNGNVLLAGGLGYEWVPPEGPEQPPPVTVALDNAELYDGGAGDFTLTKGTLQTARYDQTATLLPNGLVLIAGGTGPTGESLSSAEIYDPTTDSFSPVANPMQQARAQHSATLLTGGKVLLVGGIGAGGSPLASGEIFDPSAQTFWPAANTLQAARYAHVAALLPGTAGQAERVLIAGGQGGAGTLASAEVFDASSSTFAPTSDMNAARTQAIGLRLGDGDVLICGGGQGSSASLTPLSSAELYVSAPEPPPDELRDTLIYAQSEELELAPEIIAAPVGACAGGGGASVTLDTYEPGLAQGQRLIFTGRSMRVAPAESALAPRPTLLGGVTGAELSAVHTYELLAAVPASGGHVSWLVRLHDGAEAQVEAPAAAFELVEPDQGEARVSELTRIQALQETGDGRTILVVDPPLARCYVRDSLTISANVVHASQGESVPDEVLGSGDGQLGNQSFALKKEPLTFLPTASARGYRPALDVRVDGVLWRLAASLYTSGPRSQDYALLAGLDGRAQVVFGEGTRGARLPSGGENVRATYRVGLGPEGNVESGALSLLPTQPPGIAAVTNPMPATGGTAAASSADVRRGAPLSVQGLERAVSLSDFTTFALNYAGVAKAEALAAESGGTTRVFLTLAGPDGRAVEGDVLEGLLAALLAASAPGTVCEAQSYELRLFAVHAAVRVDPRHQAPAVLDAARAALLSAFAFDQRHFAQGVAASAVTDAIQATPGVVAVDLDAFHPAGGSGVSAFLASLPARPAPGGTAPAQLLLIDPHDLRLLEWPA